MPIMMKRRRIPIRYRIYRANGLIACKHLIIILIFLSLALAVSFSLGQESEQKHKVFVVDVLDGDTIKVVDASGEFTVRLLGVDTPETHHPKKPVQCFGKEASEFTMSILKGKYVYLEYDIERHDKYDRLLAYVYLDGTMINKLLIEQGYARLLVIEPNKSHARELLGSEVKAKTGNVGLWKYC